MLSKSVTFVPSHKSFLHRHLYCYTCSERPQTMPMHCSVNWSHTTSFLPHVSLWSAQLLHWLPSCTGEDCSVPRQPVWLLHPGLCDDHVQVSSQQSDPAWAHSLVATYHICWPIVQCVCVHTYVHMAGLRVRITHSCVERRNVAH